MKLSIPVASPGYCQIPGWEISNERFSDQNNCFRGLNMNRISFNALCLGVSLCLGSVNASASIAIGTGGGAAPAPGELFLEIWDGVDTKTSHSYVQDL
ncbi:MAG: hypothetical protein PHE55_12335, partial [Methylococcaceae bacterium]|nr:hypothetical protein [Methylococcaceae bacterium]